MKVVNNKTMDLSVGVEVPESIEEYDQRAGKVGAALDDAIKFVLFHDWNSQFRSNFVEALEKSSGVERPINQEATDKQTPKKDGTKTPVYLNEKKYLDLVLATTKTKVNDYQELANEVAAKIPFDPSEGTRGGGRIAKEFLDAADSIIAKGEEAIAKAVARLQELNPGLVVDLGDDGADGQREGLARGIQVNQQRKLRESEQELLA